MGPVTLTALYTRQAAVQPNWSLADDMSIAVVLQEHRTTAFIMNGGGRLIRVALYY